MAGKGRFWLGVLVGAAAGAASALLYSPKKGEELRGDIAESARKAGATWGEVKGKASGAASTAKERVQQMAGRGREMMASGRIRAREAIEAGRQAADEKRRELKAHMEAKEHEGCE